MTLAILGKRLHQKLCSHSQGQLSLITVNRVSFEFKNIIIIYNLQKAIIGGIVAAAITLSGDKKFDSECKTGYVKVDDVCEETCALNPCQEMIQNLLRADPIKMRLDPVSQDR